MAKHVALFAFVMFLRVPGVGAQPPSLAPGPSAPGPSLAPAQEEVAKLFQALKTTPDQVEAAGAVFGEKMGAGLATPTPDSIAAMKVALADVLLTLRRLQADNSWPKVHKLPGGKEAVAAVESYLKEQEAIIGASGPELIRAVSDGGLAGPARHAKITALIEQNRKRAAVVEAALAKALSTFAQENGLVELHEFIAQDRSCKALMPAITENKVNDNDGVKNTYYLAEDKNGVFMLSHADVGLPGETEAAVVKRLEEGRAGMVRKLGLRVARETPVVLAGKYPGRELEGELPDNKTLARIRLYLVNGRIYQLWVVGPPAWAACAEATRFLGSLELLK